jgi:hypothetical protein
MSEGINLSELTAFEQPPWNDAQSVASAFASIQEARDEASSLAAYHRLLYAVGNDHAGTYYSVVLGTLPAIEGVLSAGHPWSQHAALEVLLELCGTFEPEPGQEFYDGVPLPVLLRLRSLKLAPLVRALATGENPTAESAKRLLEVFQRLHG